MIHVLHLLASSTASTPPEGLDLLGGDASIVSEVKAVSPAAPWILGMGLRGISDSSAHLIHAWDFLSLRAAISKQLSLPIVFTPTGVPTDRDAAWLRAHLPVPDQLGLVFDSAEMLACWQAIGVSPTQCHLIRPGVPSDEPFGLVAESMRANLGLKRSDFVVLLVGESSASSRHDLAVWASSIARVIEHDLKLVLWRHGELSALALRRAVSLDGSTWCVVAEAKLQRLIPFAELCGVADLVLLTADAPVSSWPIAHCMASGLPILATENPIAREWLAADVTACFVEATPKSLARAILKLKNDPQRRKRLGQGARDKAIRDFSIEAYLTAYRNLYETMTERASNGGNLVTSSPR